MYCILLASSSQPLGLMQFLESDETVSDDEIDRMHIRDNLKAVTVSYSLVSYLCIYTGNNNILCALIQLPFHVSYTCTLAKHHQQPTAVTSTELVLADY